MYEELVTRCHANARDGISDKDIALREAAYAIEHLESMLFTGEGVNLLSYWEQQCQITENELISAREELNEKDREINNLRNELERMKSIMHVHGNMAILGLLL